MATKVQQVVLLLAVLSAVNGLASRELFFLSTPRDTTARVGQTVTLYCSINQPGSRYMWIMDGVIISQGYNIMSLPDPSRYSIGGGETSYNLHIRDLQAYDAGSYKCVVTTGTAGIISDPAQLEVQTPPTSDLPDCASDAPLSVAIGEVVQISCTVPGGRPSPDITIYRNYHTLQHNDESQESVSYTWTVAEDDQGATFRCEGRHDLWAETRNCQMGPYNVITDQIRVVLVPLSEIVEVGGSTSFVCHQSAPIRSSFTWLVNGIPVDYTDSSYSVQSGDISSILKIDPVARRLDGSIVACIVQTSQDTLSEETTLTLSETALRTPAPTRPDTVDQGNDVDTPRKDDTDGLVPDESVVNMTGYIIAAVGICVVVMIIFVLVVLGFIQMIRKKSNDQKTIITHPEIRADTDDYYFKSKFVNVQKTWFGPVHNDTSAGICNSFPLQEGPRMLITIADNDDEGVLGSTDA